MTLTTDQVLALAPDASSVAAARKLAVPGKWPTLARTSEVIWGEAKGSGAQPYLVGVDLRTAEAASKCSCPSRKFPCKHALALLLLHVGGQGEWRESAPPEPLQKWLDGRQARAEAPPAAREARAVDPAARARREAARTAKVTRGLAELQVWLADLIREGILAARTRSYREWDAQAARLIDAQAPGAARLVRLIPGLLHGQDAQPLLAHLGRLALLCEGWTRRGTLSGPEREQLLAALGQPTDTVALTAGEGTPGPWTVLGTVQETADRLEVRRTWLSRLRDGQVALLLDFAPAGRAFPAPPLPARHTASLDVRFVPTAHEQRALLAGEPSGLDWQPGVPDFQVGSIAQLYAAHARALALNPWLERVAVGVGPVELLPEPFEAHDEYGHALPLTGVSPYVLLAQARGERVRLFGEWDGEAYRPVLLLREGEVTHV